MRCAVRADIDGDGNEEILCGGDDEHIYVLNDNGHQLAQHLMTERLIIGQGGTENPCVNNLLVESFRGTDDTWIVAGFTNSQISLFDSSFNRIWNRGGIFHGVRKLQSTDLRGDGLQMPGAFLVKNGRILRSQVARNASDMPKVGGLFGEA